MKIGERLRALRLKRKLSQEEVARHIGITRSAYSHYEINNRQPVYETLIKLAAYFEVSLDHIIGGTPTGQLQSPPDIPNSQKTRELLDMLKPLSEDQRQKSIDLLIELMKQESRFVNGDKPSYPASLSSNRGK
ncbi:MAG: helix-turn-helix transcriptional regulator [Candidatus Cohnella colombiensis]|uniref:Helix-turn-helix transcriptional regulator n=1 Tax=Candidatus Cohnella colombiensis TaxID=3121368 RepID=A0AA95F2R4_9BACL|nr:MAG: helix-turn-helix transcriptional regulator [Cohnella sp.]